jgi:DNA-binding transcriptional LysR family regulator
MPDGRSEMSLTHLRYFDEVVRTGSIRLAAERLRITASAISRQVQKIEDQIGAPLFVRNARGVVLTSAGELYASYARAALLERDRIHGEIEDLKGLRRGHVRICTAEGIVDELLGNVATFRTRYPGVTFHVVVVGSEQIHDILRAGDADLGIAYTASVQPGIRYASQRKAPIFAVMTREHPLASERRVSLAATMAHPLAVPDKTFGLRRLLDNQCQSSRLTLRPVLEANSIQALRTFVRSGGGVTFLPLVTVRRDIAERAVVAVPMLDDKQLAKGTLDICVSDSRKLPKVAATFIAYLQLALAGSDESFA